MIENCLKWVMDKKITFYLFISTQVCLYFHHKLYRGNRVTKVDSESFKAFASPNLPPLANAEVDINSNSSSSNIYGCKGLKY